MVLHLRDQDLVPLLKVPKAPGVGHQVHGLGGVAHKDDLLGLGVEKAGQAPPRLLVGLGGLGGEPVGPPVDVGVQGLVVAPQGLYDPPGLLARGGGVQVDELRALGEEGEVLPQGA